MSASATKTQKSDGKSATNSIPQGRSAGESTFQFEDNRPQAIAQRKLQEIADHSPQARQARALQTISDNTQKTGPTAQLQALAAHHCARQHRYSQTGASERPDTPALQPQEPSEAKKLLQGKFAADAMPAQPRDSDTPAGLPAGLKSGMESLSGISLDNVTVHYNSSLPAQLNALAYAQGSSIHVAPGQERHLPHEAWHVIQQAQGRVPPTRQMKGGISVNDDQGLEHEADVMGARASAYAAPLYPASSPGSRQHAPLATLQARHDTAPPAAGVLQRVGSAFPKIDEANYDPKFHNTSFLVRVSLTPMSNDMGNEQFRSSELWVSEVTISNDRPPTKFGSEGQRSHTVAWSLLRAALQGLGGQPLDRFIVMLGEMRAHLQVPTLTEAAAKAFQAQYDSLEAGVATISDTTRLTDFSHWQLAASELASNYVHAYQLSDEATYADGQAVGHGEPGHMATLRRAEDLARQGTDLSGDLQGIKEAARGMLDIKARLSDKIVGAVLQHWVNDLFLAFPTLMSRHHADIVAGLGLSEQNLSDALGGVDPTAPLPWIRDKSATHSVEASGTPAEVALPIFNRATFTANVVLTPNVPPGTQRELDLTAKDSGIPTDQTKLNLAHYQIHQLDIAQLEVADDRPNTRFGALQRSHTVAWTLVRRHLMHFSGKGAAALANFVLNELTTLRNDIDTPAQNSKIGFDAPAQAEEKRQNLYAIITHPDGFPLFRWQSLLSELVETYVTLYQLSRSATYSKEERPKGHGEANAISTLQNAEDYLATGGMLDPGQYLADNEKDIVEAAVKLVDATVATSTLKPHNWKIAIEHWLHLVRDQYPRLTSLPGFTAAVEEKISVMEPQEELLAGYTKPGNKREKVLINLYENAKREVKNIPDAFLPDLYSSIRLSLARFQPPDYDRWEAAVNGIKLNKGHTNAWWGHIASYGKPSSRKVKMAIPDEHAIGNLIADADKYFSAVQSDRGKLIDFFTGKMSERTDGATRDFIDTNLHDIQAALGEGIDEAIELSSVGTMENYREWYDLIHKIDINEAVTYATLSNAMTK